MIFGKRMKYELLNTDQVIFAACEVILIKVNEEIFITMFKEKKQPIFGNQFTTNIGSRCDYQKKYFLIDFFVSLCTYL